MDFWRSSPYRLLERREDGLYVSADFLRHFLSRPELTPDEASCSHERDLHARMMEEPRTKVTRRQIERVADTNARENWQVWLDFREDLLRAPTLEAAYSALFAGNEIKAPLLFINELVQVILRGILDGCDDALELRAAELFFRAQKISLHDGAVLAADLALVEGKAMGSLGRWLSEKGVPVKSIELEVLDEKNAQSYFSRDERHDMVLAINGTGGLALARVIEKWIEHFHEARVTIIPVPKIAGESWVWHLGLDAEASRLLNDLYRGIEVAPDDLMRLLALFTLSFAQASDARPELNGRPVYLGLAMSPDNVLRLKPQNLLTNLPLARRT
ncbi:MAG: DUF6352 family protein [Burkholderiales bacterium]